MLRFLLLLVSVYLLAACVSGPETPARSAITQDATQLNNITLSHVLAYLRIGNIVKAEERFQHLEKPESNPQAMLALAELMAAKGDVPGAQQAFLSGINHPALNRQQVSPALLDYLCEQKQWQTLEGYASGLLADELDDTVKNQQLSTIGLCFFDQQQWPQASQWLSQLDFSQPVDPVVYLALARFAVEQQDSSAPALMEKFTTTKTQVNAQILWHAFEVYSALQQHQLAAQAAQQLMILFPNTAYARKYLILSKRAKSVAEKQVSTVPAVAAQPGSEALFHRIKKGETLYQLSKRYGVSVADLLKWNPTLVVEDIALGTAIKVFQ